MLKMTSEPEGGILGADCGLRAFATYRIKGLKMIMTKDANKITRLMGLIPIQASNNFRSNRQLGIFRRPDGTSKSFVKYMNQPGMSGYSLSASNYP